MSALFAYLHSLSMIAMGAMLFAMMLTFDLLHEREGFRRFWVLSLGVATAAAVALASGIALVIWTDSGSAFYLHNPVFYIKLAGLAHHSVAPGCHERRCHDRRHRNRCSWHWCDRGYQPGPPRPALCRF